jgi:type VI secretion system protein ImpK
VQAVKQRAALRWLPLAAAVAAVAAAALVVAAVNVGLSISLSDESDPVFSRVRGLRLPPPEVAAASPSTRTRLAQYLQSDIKAGLVAVRDELDRSVVTIRADSVFPAGSATLKPEQFESMGRIADALARGGGQILVTGHTDSTPMRSARFPSNWHISGERARAIRDLLIARKFPADRIQAEGRADSEPVAPNDTSINRTLNRRIEIRLIVGRGEHAPAAAPRATAPPAKS